MASLVLVRRGAIGTQQPPPRLYNVLHSPKSVPPRAVIPTPFAARPALQSWLEYQTPAAQRYGPALVPPACATRSRRCVGVVVPLKPPTRVAGRRMAPQ